MKKFGLYLFFVFLIAFLDQYSKYLIAGSFNISESMAIIDGFLNFTYAKNSGAAFSFGAGYSDVVRMLMFKILPVLVCLWLFKLLYDAILDSEKLMTLAYTLILGGAIGNLIDRIRLDYVVDFISVYHRGFTLFEMNIKPWYFAIFNIADSAISIAAVLISLDYLLKGRKKETIKS